MRPTAGLSDTTSSVTPRSITTTSPGCRTLRAIGYSRTRSTSALRCNRPSSPPTPRKTCRASTRAPTRWRIRFPRTPTFWSSARRTRRVRRAHRRIRIQGSRTPWPSSWTMSPAPARSIWPHRLRPVADFTVAVPGECGRLDVGATGAAAERLELQQPTFSGNLGSGSSPPPLPPIGTAPGAAAAVPQPVGSRVLRAPPARQPRPPPGRPAPVGRPPARAGLIRGSGATATQAPRL